MITVILNNFNLEYWNNQLYTDGKDSRLDYLFMKLDKIFNKKVSGLRFHGPDGDEYGMKLFNIDSITINKTIYKNSYKLVNNNEETAVFEFTDINGTIHWNFSGDKEVLKRVINSFDKDYIRLP